MKECGEKLSYSVGDSCNMLGIGRTKLYALINEGRLSTIRVGRRRLVTRVSLVAFVEGASSRA